MKRQIIAEEDVKTATIRQKEETIKAETDRKTDIIRGEGRGEARKKEAEGIREEYAARGSTPQGGDFSYAESIAKSMPGVIVLGGGAGVMIPPPAANQNPDPNPNPVPNPKPPQDPKDNKNNKNKKRR